MRGMPPHRRKRQCWSWRCVDTHWQTVACDTDQACDSGPESADAVIQKFATSRAGGVGEVFGATAMTVELPRSAFARAAVVGALVAVCIAGATLASAAASIGTSGPAGSLVAARDRAATLSYLKARLSYERALAAAAPVSEGSLEGLASRLGGECPGVVAGVAAGMRDVRPVQGSPREQAEADRKRKQWQDLIYEVSRTIGLARSVSYRQSALRFAHKVLALRWSDGMVTAFEHANAKATEWEVDGETPPVCADLSYWMASDDTRLFRSTKALIRQKEAAERPLSRMVRLLFETPHGLTSNPLARYEGPRARALSRSLHSAFEGADDGMLGGVFDAGERVRIALGVTSEAESKQFAREVAKLGAERKIPPKGAVIVARGKSAAGNSYTIWTEPRRRGDRKVDLLQALSMPRECHRAVGIRESTPALLEGIEFSGEPNAACLSLTHPKAPRVRCAGEVRTIEAQMPAWVRRVRLTLRDGHQITSNAAMLPRSLVGPARFYYQALQVWVSPPVALTELDGRGRALRTLRLHVPHCPTQWPFVALGAVRKVAGGRLPGGPKYSIIASPKQSSGESEPSLRVEVAGVRSVGGFQYDDAPFEWEMETACEPHRYAIIYGTVANPRDTVWARGPAGVSQLRRTVLPAGLHPHGVLAYGAFETVPSELVIRAPDGKVLHERKLTRIARRFRETCEGEAEPTE